MKKSIIFKILSFCMILCFAIISVGCIGTPANQYPGDFDEDDFLETMAVEMYGSKVLYRPPDYDYDIGSGATGDETNNYYGKYAYYIIQNLFRVYGLSTDDYIFGTTDQPGALPNFNDSEEDSPWHMDMTSYLYDSIRYQVDTLGYVTKTQQVTTTTNNVITSYGEITDISIDPYYVVGADINVAWEWTLRPDLESIRAYNFSSNTNNEEYSIVQDGKVYRNSSDEPSSSISGYYDTQFDSNIYQSLYLSSNTDQSEAPNDEASYSDYVKTLEYVIYSYAVDLEPEEAIVTTTDVGYEITIGGQDVDTALAEAKDTFTKLGTYVGLADRQIDKIETWILNNVIGEVALNDQDLFTNYTTDVIEYVNQKGEIVGYDFSQAQSQAETNALGRDYRTAVSNIMEGVCDLVSIGSDENGEDVTIDQRFPASEIMEYAGNMFFISDDDNFPALSQDGTTPMGTLQPLEYQSVVLMLDQEVYLHEIWVALKYDADLSGTTEGEFGSEYIDVIVDINYYNHTENTRQVLASKQVRVYDGPYDIDFIQMDSGITGNNGRAPDDHNSGMMFGDLGGIHVGRFNTDIGNNVLKTDVGSVGNYQSAPYVSTSPIMLVGTSSVRRYYEIVEYGSNPQYDTDQLPAGYTYTSARLNPEMFSGSEGCDYIEITYKVLKEAGNTDKNYRFYTGISMLDYSETPDDRRP